MLECLNCGYTSHFGFGSYPNMKCPNCGGVKLISDDYGEPMPDAIEGE